MADPSRADGRLVGRPSHFFLAHLSEIVGAAGGQPVLDLACGRGRHALAAAEKGLRVVAIDRRDDYLRELSKVDIEGPGSIEGRAVDLESDVPPAGVGANFGAILVSRYLHRPLMPWIEEALMPGGLLLYETFTAAQRDLGWGPKRDAFLLQPGELLELTPRLIPLVYEEGLSGDEPPAETARLLARRPD